VTASASASFATADAVSDGSPADLAAPTARAAQSRNDWYFVRRPAFSESSIIRSTASAERGSGRASSAPIRRA
jgi:hypothetical protein